MAILLKPKDKPQPRKRRNRVRSKITKARRELEEALFGLLRPLIFARDGGACVACGGMDKLAMAHILPQGTYKRVRFEPDNIMTMDYKCHLGSDGWHKNPLKWRAWFEEKFPGKYERLLIADRCSPKVDVKYLISIWSNERVRALWLERCEDGEKEK